MATPCRIVSGNAFQLVREFRHLDVVHAVGVKVRDVRAVLVMFRTCLDRGPVLHEHEASRLVLILEKVVPDVAVLFAGRLDNCRKVAAQLVLLARLGLEPDDDKQFAHVSCSFAGLKAAAVDASAAFVTRISRSRALWPLPRRPSPG